MLKFRDKIECVFWMFNESAHSDSRWAANGCEYIAKESNKTVTVCECDHLTNFAALMDIRGREKNTKFKSILTYLCSSLSIVAMIITLIVLAIPKRLRDRRNTITCNLCVCLLIANLLIVFGMDATNYDVSYAQ